MSNSLEVIKSQKSRCRYWLIRLIIVSVLVALVTMGILYKETVNHWIEELSGWLREHPVIGPITLSAIYVVITIFSLPGFVLALAAGVAF